jgi:hypothetical protein
VVELVMPARYPAPIAAACSKAAALALNEYDVELGRKLTELDRRPQTRVAAPDYADVGV